MGTAAHYVHGKSRNLVAHGDEGDEEDKGGEGGEGGKGVWGGEGVWGDPPSRAAAASATFTSRVAAA